MKYAWFGLAVVVSAFLCWNVYDLKTEVKNTTAGVRETNEMVKEKLPPILDNSKKASETLFKLSEEVSTLRNLIAPATGSGGTDPVSLAKFSEKILEFIEKADVEISSVGSGWRKSKDWVAGERKEAFYLAFRAKDKRDLLEKMSSTVFGNPWMIRTGSSAKAEKMLDWLKKNNKELDELYPEKK